MKLSLIPKSESLSDPEATGKIISLVFVMLLVSIAFRDSILLFLYEPMVAVVPGIDKALQTVTHGASVKSFWSFAWFLFPGFFVWVVCLAFRVKDKVPIKKRWFFPILFCFLFFLFACYSGFYSGKKDAIYWRGRFYGDGLFGMYMMGFVCWQAVYLFLFITLRFLISWARRK